MNAILVVKHVRAERARGILKASHWRDDLRNRMIA
jgi:hypothetical protein